MADFFSVIWQTLFLSYDGKMTEIWNDGNKYIGKHYQMKKSVIWQKKWRKKICHMTEIWPQNSVIWRTCWPKWQTFWPRRRTFGPEIQTFWTIWWRFLVQIARFLSLTTPASAENRTEFVPNWSSWPAIWFQNGSIWWIFRVQVMPYWQDLVPKYHILGSKSIQMEARWGRKSMPRGCMSLPKWMIWRRKLTQVEP